MAFDPWGVKVKPKISGKEVNNLEIKCIIKCRVSSSNNLVGWWHTMSSPFLHVFQMNRKGPLSPLQIVQTGAMLQCYSKRGKLSHSDKELVLGFFLA